MPATTDGSQTVMDPVAETLAAAYARALLDLVGPDEEGAVRDELSSVARLLGEQTEFASLLASAALAPPRRAEIVARVFGSRVSRRVEGLLSVMAANGRMDILPRVADAFGLLLDGRHGRVEVELVTARPVDRATLDKLAEALRRATGAEPLIRNSVDDGLLAGAVMKIGDRVYDASLAGELDRLRDALVGHPGDRRGHTTH
jgi:F-type H+-transporting ATPase subunit delta